MKMKKEEIGSLFFDLLEMGFTWDKFNEGTLSATSTVMYNQMKTQLLAFMKIRPIENYYHQPWYWGIQILNNPEGPSL